MRLIGDRSMSRDLINDANELHKDATDLRQNTAQILLNLAQVKSQIPQDTGGYASNLVLEQYLEEFTGYAEKAFNDLGKNSVMEEADDLDPARLLATSPRLHYEDQPRALSHHSPSVIDYEDTGGFMDESECVEVKEEAILSEETIFPVIENSLPTEKSISQERLSSESNIQSFPALIENQASGYIVNLDGGRTIIHAQTGRWSLGKRLGGGSASSIKLGTHLETSKEVCEARLDVSFCSFLSDI
jgi:hypothetical protein